VADDDKDDGNDDDKDDTEHVAEAPSRPGFPLPANGTAGQLQFVSAEADLEDIFRKPSIGERFFSLLSTMNSLIIDRFEAIVLYNLLLCTGLERDVQYNDELPSPILPEQYFR
jgi:hypothetical protein